MLLAFKVNRLIMALFFFPAAHEDIEVGQYLRAVDA
jgi:hypothetical protein